MGVLLAVIDDLFQFALTSLLGVFTIGGDRLPAFVGSGMSSVMTKKSDGAPAPFETMPAQGGQYFIGETGVKLYIDPVVSFDTALETLSYGELVFVHKLGGRWAYILVHDVHGWIFKDALRDRAKDVLPFLISGMGYRCEDAETKKLRSCIEDMFGGERASVPLTDVEYVTFRLLNKGKQILWDNARPRVAGTWQQKLRGKLGIHMGIVPKTDSVLEYIADDVGHLCFVDAVFPDQSIKISAVGLQTEGVFEEVALDKEAWKELRPVFIEVG